jgi:hypothetical protein
MSAIEQEPQTVGPVTITAAETLLAAVVTPGVSSDRSISALSAPTAGVTVCPFKVVRVRGIVWTTNGGSFLTIRLRQGVGTGGAQVGVPFTNTVNATAAAGLADVPVPFEFVDAAPVGTNYTLTCITSTGSVATYAIWNVTGFDG